MANTLDIDGGGVGEKSEQETLAGGEGVAAEEAVGVTPGPAGEKLEKDAGAGLQSNESAAAVDDPAELGTSLIDDNSDMVPSGRGDSFDYQISQGICDGADEAADSGLAVQDDGPLITGNDVAVGGDGEDAQDEEGAPMYAVPAAELIDGEAELVNDEDDVAEESTEMDTHPSNGNANEEEGVAATGDPSMDKGREMDAVSMSKDVDEVKAASAFGVDAIDDDIQVNTVGLTGVDNKKREISSAGDDSADEKGMENFAVIMRGGETKNVAEEAGSVPEEAELDMIDNVFAEEVTVMDILSSTGNGNEDEGVATGGDASVDEGRLLDALSISRDINEEKRTEGAATSEDILVDGDNNQEKEVASSGDDDDDEPPPLTRKGGGRPKRGLGSLKAQAVVKPSVKRKDEQVCFICFDGGELLFCDRRSCPKAYHPSCINRDDKFFKSKGQWTCGWHICSNCLKHACQMCYMCTYSLCKACIQETNFICVKGTKGFCETCMNTVMLIENKKEATEQMDIDFDDKRSWWSLFKDYWFNLKEKLPLIYEEISAARRQKNGSSLVICDNDLSVLPEANDDEEDNSPKTRGKKRLKRAADGDNSKGKGSTLKYTKQGSGSCDAKTKKSTCMKVRKLSKRASSSEHGPKDSVWTSASSAEEASWASTELLDFFAHMRNGAKSVLSQFEVQGLVLEYIQRENLSDPCGKSQKVCDPLLQSLSGKERVGHFEMLKLLESHYLLTEVSPVDIDGNHGGVVDPDPSKDAAGNSEVSVVMSSEKRRKPGKYDQRGLQANLDDFVAIDNHNISLMYLRRNLMEELISDADTFSEKVFGAFVRIRISGTDQRQGIYRLVQIVGTGTAAEKYKCGKRTTDITLEILNLDKRQFITIDMISNQEFTEEECKRLQQSIKCGFISRLTVGEIQEKARVLQSLKTNDWIESEKMCLVHLHDRSSDMVRKNDRECVEQLKFLSTPEERACRLKEEPKIHADPAMDPNYESPEEPEEDAERSSFSRQRYSFSRKDSDPVSPSKSESPSIGAHKVNMEAATANAPCELSAISVQTLTANLVSAAPASQSTVNESEEIWQYMDPSNKVQGPFSMIQLHKWNIRGHFPPDLKIWKYNEKQEDSLLLADALVGKFEKNLPPWEPPLGSSSQTDKAYLQSNSHVGARPSSESLFEERTKADEQICKSQPFTVTVSQRHDDTTNPGSTMFHSSAQSYYGMQNCSAAFAHQHSFAESSNASSSQLGTTINNMTLSQPTVGGFSGQNDIVAGNVDQLTPVPAPATVITEIVNSQFSGKDLGLVGAQPGAAPSNSQQFEASYVDARNQSIEASNSAQLMSTASSAGGESQNSGWSMPPQVANTSGQAQGAITMKGGSTLESNADMAWGVMGQTHMNMPWTAPAQGATSYNMGLTMPTQQNAVPNMGWVRQSPGNANMNMMWTTNQGLGTPNAAAMMFQIQGVTMAPCGGAIAQGNANSYPGWVPQVGKVNQHVGWTGPVQGNPGPNPGSGQGNNNMNWNSSSGKPTWNNQQDFNGGDSRGPRPGRRRSRPPLKKGICFAFAKSGHCNRDDCPFLHTQTDDGHAPRNDPCFDSQP